MAQQAVFTQTPKLQTLLQILETTPLDEISAKLKKGNAFQKCCQSSGRFLSFFPPEIRC